MKTRRLHDLHNVDIINSFLVFVFFSKIDVPPSFEETPKNGVWEKAMDE